MMHQSNKQCGYSPEARIQKSLIWLLEGRTSFVIAHRLSTIREADKVVVVQDSDILELGTHHQRLDRKNFHQHLYMCHFNGETI